MQKFAQKMRQVHITKTLNMPDLYHFFCYFHKKKNYIVVSAIAKQLHISPSIIQWYKSFIQNLSCNKLIIYVIWNSIQIIIVKGVCMIREQKDKPFWQFEKMIIEALIIYYGNWSLRTYLLRKMVHTQKPKAWDGVGWNKTQFSFALLVKVLQKQ